MTAYSREEVEKTVLSEHIKKLQFLQPIKKDFCNPTKKATNKERRKRNL